VSGAVRVTVSVAAGGAALFHMFAAGVSPFTALVQRPVHLALMGVIGFLLLGRPRRTSPGAEAPVDDGSAGAGARGARWDAWALAAALILACAYVVWQNQELVRRSGAPTTLDLAAGGAAILLVLELARRATGWGIVAVCLVALAYGVAGPYLPGFLAHRGYGPVRLIEHLYLSTEGIWGVPLGVSADFVYLFVFFGAVLEAAGGGVLLVALANRVAGKTRGGPAKTSAVASALMGTLSGSAVANVVTTGAFTIPIMKRAGFRPHFAAAVEAAASTGGQIMPPIMGAGAFILATWTSIPYVRVAAAAAIPAMLYYLAVLAAIHFRAGRMGIEPAGTEGREPVVDRIHLLLPIAIIVVFLAEGRSPMRAAFWGVVSALALVYLRPHTRPSFSDLRRMVDGAGRGAVQVAAACAAAGIVVGVASLTGIGLRMSELIVTLSHGSLLAALILTALGSLVLGMGLPTTAAYVVLAALGAPALVEMGVPLLGAHLFIFYFGCISNVTPPVALAAFAAAGVAGSPPMRTGATAAVLASAGFLVPFMFIYGPPLLLDGSVGQIAGVSLTAALGVTLLAAATMGYLRRPLAPWERVVLGGGALGLVTPGLVTDLTGLLALGVVLLRRR